ncbi:hypothetical protein D9K79_12255 [Acinetobacter cumulans]|uniref:Uncharacterized protein n=1 Tax=Acinetobacter cumulans TaxID=2136182 RepID=A0ABX9U408_9GAMM|nr:hypothetical protein D9K79_12255 [Acinetobacter cumulans]
MTSSNEVDLNKLWLSLMNSAIFMMILIDLLFFKWNIYVKLGFILYLFSANTRNKFVFHYKKSCP